MYEEFYGFEEKPFQIVPNPNYLYLSPKHKNALSCLEYGLSNNGGYILLTGEIGSGKTTLIRYLLKNLDAGIVPAVIFNTNVTAEEFFIFVMQSFDLKYKLNEKAKNLELLCKFMLEHYVEGRQVLLIIDEAQNLSDATLEEIRMLSNFQSDDRLLLQIILVGQPELRARFKNPSLVQFAQRIAVNYHLKALTGAETRNYIVFRLKKAGGKPDTFSADAIDAIFRASRGIPRMINLLCDSALVYGFADEADRIDTRIIKTVIDELGIIGLYDKSAYENTPLPVSNTEDGNGFLRRLEKIEAGLQNLRVQLESQNGVRKRQTDAYKKALIAKAKQLIKSERNRNLELWEDNKRLRMKLKELESKSNFGKFGN
jgi:putative secretion ATPase (PEP-CTERM system associated)